MHTNVRMQIATAHMNVEEDNDGEWPAEEVSVWWLEAERLRMYAHI